MAKSLLCLSDYLIAAGQASLRSTSYIVNQTCGMCNRFAAVVNRTEAASQSACHVALLSTLCLERLTLRLDMTQSPLRNATRLRRQNLDVCNGYLPVAVAGAFSLSPGSFQ